MAVNKLRNICFHPRTPSFASPLRSTTSLAIPPPTPASQRKGESGGGSGSGSGSVTVLSDLDIEKIIEEASVMVTKWNPDTTNYVRVTSLFYESKREAAHFVKCVTALQCAMDALMRRGPSTRQLVAAQGLMQVAMKRLQKEFYLILSMNRAHLDPESISTRSRSSHASTARSSTSDYSDDGSPEDDIRVAGDSIVEVEEASSIVMEDLRLIAECMITSGYAKECISIYRIIRKSIIDEGIYRLGVEKISHSHNGKMDWEVQELKIKNWLNAVKVSMWTLFTGERILCDHVFASSNTIRESTFAAISGEGAALLFGYPEVVARGKKSSQEKIFRLLDMYTTISEHWAEIDSIFAFESTSGIRSQAVETLIQLADSIRSMLADFEASLQKESSKSPVAGGGIHPQTIQSMNYLALVADYNNIVVDIFAESPLPEKPQLPASYIDSPHPDDEPASVISQKIAWLILILLCKLDRKAERYKDMSLSYLFLANNVRHVVLKVRQSNLKSLLGNEWIARHDKKVGQFAGNYARLAWAPVLTTLPEDPTALLSPEEAREHFRKFISSFDDAYMKQASNVIPDPQLRDEIKMAIERNLVPAYKRFYDIHKLTLCGDRDGMAVIRLSPEDIGNQLSYLFFGPSDPSTVSISSSSSSSSSHWRHSHLAQ